MDPARRANRDNCNAHRAAPSRETSFGNFFHGAARSQPAKSLAPPGESISQTPVGRYYKLQLLVPGATHKPPRYSTMCGGLRPRADNQKIVREVWRGKFAHRLYF